MSVTAQPFGKCFEFTGIHFLRTEVFYIRIDGCEIEVDTVVGVAAVLDIKTWGHRCDLVEVDGTEDRTDQKRAEQALCHGAHGIDTVMTGGDHNIFSLEKCFDFAHVCFTLFQ